MIISQKYREQFSGFLNVVGSEFDNVIATLRAWSNVEHNDDGTHSPNVGNLLQFVAGANIGGGQVVYLSSGADQRAPGQAFLADASSVTKSTQAAVVGMATMSVSAGQNVVTRDRGIFSGLVGLTAGKGYYIGTTPGSLTLTQPTNAVLVGVAVSTTELLLLLRNPTTLAGQAILTWTGTTSGTQNMESGTTLPFLGAGTYSITVNSAVTLTCKGTAGGGGGGGGSSGAGNLRGGGGGGGGATTTGTNVALVTGKTYTLVIGAGGSGGASSADGTAGASTTFVNTTDTVTLVSLAGGAKGVTSGGGGGVGGALVTGSNGVTGGTGGNDTGAGVAAANGAGGGGGGGTNGTGGAGGNGSVTGGAGGAAGVGGTSKSGTGGGATANSGGGGGAGGSQFTLTGESANGYGGGGGGGGGEQVAGSGGSGGAGGAGVAAFVFVSAP